MTREEAIEVLQASSIKQMSLTKIIVNGKALSVKTALEMAIKALKQEPCEDAISRDAVKELIKCGESTDTYDDVEQVCKWIDALPSVTQKSTEEATKELKESAYKAFAKEYLKKSTEEATKEFMELLESGYYGSTYKPNKWIVHEKPHGIRYLECPYCNIWYLNEHLIRNSYCPNCGAKMIESQESEE